MKDKDFDSTLTVLKGLIAEKERLNMENSQLDTEIEELKVQIEALENGDKFCYEVCGQNQSLEAQNKELNRFVSLVYTMRNKQKEYFKSRNFKSLAESKELEKAVDSKIKELQKKCSVSGQQDLF